MYPVLYEQLEAFEVYQVITVEAPALISAGVAQAVIVGTGVDEDEPDEPLVAPDDGAATVTVTLLFVVAPVDPVHVIV